MEYWVMADFDDHPTDPEHDVQIGEVFLEPGAEASNNRMPTTLEINGYTYIREDIALKNFP